jgi:hypothetical protein
MTPLGAVPCRGMCVATCRHDRLSAPTFWILYALELRYISFDRNH